jgi:glycosyltransferase involved in cell wall biosynthesis
VADGGSQDGTATSARSLGCRVLEAPTGRGHQLRAGVEAARGEWLLILHADVRLVPPALAEAEAVITRGPEIRPRIQCATWPLAIAHESIWFRWIELSAFLRWRLMGLAYGDQGLLVTRTLYDAAGGYPETAIMEDVVLIRRLARLDRITRFRYPILVDPRRWNREGRVAGSLRNFALVSLLLAGVAPERLERWYLPEPRAH